MRGALTGIAVVMGAMGVASCALGPDFVTPERSDSEMRYTAPNEAVPAQIAMGQKVRAEWWRLYGSNDLNAMITMALDNNQDFAAAKATLEQVQNNAQAANGALFPQLGLHGGAVREKVNFTSYGMSFPPATLNLYSVGGTVSYALDLFGHERRLAEAAEAAAEAQAYALNGAYLTLTGHIVIQALSAASLDAQIKAVTQVVEGDRTRVDLMRAARQAGTVSDRELAEAEGQAATDSAMLPPLKTQLAGVRHGLAVSVGQSPAQWSPPAFSLSSFTVPQDIPVSLPSELVRQRPDILAAEAELHQASAMIGAAQANRYPRLVLSADITQWATVPSQLWRNMATGAAGGGGITAPIFQGGQLESAQRAAESAYQASFARYQQTVLQAFAQVATILQGLAQDQDAVLQNQRAVQATATSSKFARLEQQNGTAGLLVVLAAERREMLSRLAEIQSRTQILKDSAELFLAMGGGWWDHPQSTL